MSAYRVNIDINDIPELEVFVSFQCNVMSVPLENDGNISFKSQVIEFNGKNRTEIPITCVSSMSNLRMVTKINKLQKGNKIEITGNLIRNDREEIKVLIKYIVYANTNSYSSTDKKDLMNKIPWLNSSKKATNEDQSHDTSDDLPNFLKNTKDITDNNVDEVIDVSNDDKDTIDISDDDKGKKL